MDTNILSLNCFREEEEFRYVWTQKFSFSIVLGRGDFDMYGPKHLVFQLFGEWELGYAWPQTFSFFNYLGSGNLDM